MIYYLSHSPQQSVQWLCDQHIKASETINFGLDTEWFKWASASRVNWSWYQDYRDAIKEEHLFRFRIPHKYDQIDEHVSGIRDLDYMTDVLILGVDGQGDKFPQIILEELK